MVVVSEAAQVIQNHCRPRLRLEKGTQLGNYKPYLHLVPGCISLLSKLSPSSEVFLVFLPGVPKRAAPCPFMLTILKG